MSTIPDRQAEDRPTGKKAESYEPPAIAVLGRFEELTLRASGTTSDSGSRAHTTSDRILKSNIRPVTAALERLRKL
jgi:hypothetical protein